MNNADVASLLGLDVLLVGNGGLGSTYDVMALNKTLCTAGGVRVRAVLLNKVCVGSSGQNGSFASRDGAGIPLDSGRISPEYKRFTEKAAKPLDRGNAS